jgi:predicted esterase
MRDAAVRIAELEAIVVPARSPSAAAIFLHGFAMDAMDLSPFARSLGLSASFFFPRGPLEVANGGRAWWLREDPVAESGPRDLADKAPPGRSAARTLLKHFIAAVSDEHAGLPILLAGFSQGGMLACDTVLLEEVSIRGLALMSASRIAAQEWTAHRHRLNALPVFVSHGRADRDLEFGAGERLQGFVRESGGKVTWHPFDGGHEIPFAVWRAFRRFVLDVINESAMQVNTDAATG